MSPEQSAPVATAKTPGTIHPATEPHMTFEKETKEWEPTSETEERGREGGKAREVLQS